MPLFSEHISNMYYSGSPSYTSPSYGYKSSYSPLGTSYSASYLSPGGSYSNHSSLGSYSRAPLSSRWIPGMSRSYSPMLTPISERGTASPIRINSPRRIPISKRCYGTPSYIQRPININTESIDVSRERYRPKPAEISQSPSASLPLEQKVDPVKDNENSPFMPRVDGKPETGIDSSPGIQRSTIKRGRTVVRLHTIKRKDKDSPRKSIETLQLQESNINKQDLPETLIDDLIPEEPKESLSWREKLSEDLVYVDKKEKKSLGTKLVEKFLVKDVIEKDSKVDALRNAGTSQTDETLLPITCEVPSLSKSPDRRCSMEMLAEQSSLLDSLIRGENLSTATLDLSKVGIADETGNKIVTSNSIKRRKTDDKGNPLKTTKSDHSLHDNLNKSLKGNSKTFTKRRSLKKSQSGGSISRLDSITEFPKESIDLPVIQENKFSPKQTKTEQKPKLRTKITASVEISPPTSPLKFRIENVIVEEKHHTPKKEISFSYDVDEIPTQDVTLQGPKSTLRRTKERNSVKKNIKKTIDTVPISPEPDDGNFWAKIGKRETVYLIKRKENIEAEKEKNKRAHYCFDVDEESGDVTNNSNVETSNDSIVKIAGSDLPLVAEPNILPKAQEVNGSDKKERELKTVSTKLEKSRSSDNMQKLDNNTHTSSLKENTMKSVTEIKLHDFVPTSNDTSEKKTFHKAEIKEDAALCSTEKTDTEKTSNFNLGLSKPGDEKSILTSEIKPNLKRSVVVPPEVTKAFSSAMKLVHFDEIANASTDLDKDLKQKTEVSGANISCDSEVGLNPLVEAPVQTKSFSLSSGLTQVEINGKHVEKDSKPTSDIITKIIDTTKANVDLNLPSERANVITAVLKTQPKSENTRLDEHSKPILHNIETKEPAKINIDANLYAKTFIAKKTIPANAEPIIQTPVKTEGKSFEKDSKLTSLSEKSETTTSTKVKDVLTETLTNTESKPNTTTTASVFQAQPMTDAKGVEQDSKTLPEQGETIKDLKYTIDMNMSTEANPKSEIVIATLQTQAEIENESIHKIYSKNLEPIENATTKSNVNLSTDTRISVESEVKVNNVITLQTQAKQKVEDKKLELSEKNKQVEKIQDVNSVLSKQKILKSTKKNVLTETSTANSKKRIKKVQAQTDKSKDVPEKINNDPKDKICETCKKSMGSVSMSTSKLNLSKIKDPSTSKASKGNDKVVKINTQADKSMNKKLETKSDLDSSVSNLSDLNPKPETSASTSQIPIVIDSKNIPTETVTSDIDQVQTSIPSQEKTGEENKAENDTKGEGNPKLKQTSIKKVAKLSPKKLIKEEKPAKPLIATPRPLLKRAPQIIHSESSDSSSEEDSSEEEESDTSENSGEFYECETNPDGRTSTGSNDSGFDSSAPTSPASFLHIKKGGGDSPGPSSSNTSSQLPATDVGDSELELEQSTAYGIFRKTGRFTPPARSIPRFRKYNIEDFQFIKVLGKGSFGKVLLAELRDTEYYYAVKCLKKDVVLEDDDVECTLIERKVLALGTNHPYLCHLFATFQTDSHLFFVMEYLNGGDLMFHIQQSGRFPEPRARFYAAEIVSGLKFLHKRGIVYRDLKLDNILLDFDGHVRIADFGMCKLQIYLDKTADTFCGTPDYMAPEIIKGLKYNQTVDWWSFGVLLYEMLIGQSPFSGCDEDELFWSICNEMPSYPRFLSKEGLTILTRLLDKDARTRLGGTECMHGDVREQDFFHPVHWDKLERRELETPFKPRVRHPLDTQYFDRAFTGERPRLTTVEPHVLRSMDQEPFRGFSYTNPNATDR